MAGDDKRLQGLFLRRGTAARRANTFTRMSLKIDDRSLADGTYRSGHDRQLYQLLPYQPLPYQPSPNSNRRGGFPNANRRDRFSNSTHDIGGGYSNTYELGFLLLMGVMILSQLYFGSIKLMSCLT